MKIFQISSGCINCQAICAVFHRNSFPTQSFIYYMNMIKHGEFMNMFIRNKILRHLIDLI